MDEKIVLVWKKKSKYFEQKLQKSLKSRLSGRPGCKQRSLSHVRVALLCQVKLGPAGEAGPTRHRGFQWALPPGAQAGDPLTPRVQHRHTVDSTSSAHVQFVSVAEPGWFSRLLPRQEPGCLSTPVCPAPTSDVTVLHINSPGGEGRPLDWASDGFSRRSPEDQIQA